MEAMNQPTLNDRRYGQMVWEDESGAWFARIEDAAEGEFEIHIASDSPLNFLAVAQSHRTFERLLSALPDLRRQAVRAVLDAAEDVVLKARDKRLVGEKFAQTLALFSVTIYEDKSAEVCFDSEIFAETDDFLFAQIGADGEFLEAAIDTF